MRRQSVEVEALMERNRLLAEQLEQLGQLGQGPTLPLLANTTPTSSTAATADNNDALGGSVNTSGLNSNNDDNNIKINSDDDYGSLLLQLTAAREETAALRVEMAAAGRLAAAAAEARAVHDSVQAKARAEAAAAAARQSKECEGLKKECARLKEALTSVQRNQEPFQRVKAELAAAGVRLESERNAFGTERTKLQNRVEELSAAAAGLSQDLQSRDDKVHTCYREGRREGG